MGKGHDLVNEQEERGEHRGREGDWSTSILIEKELTNETEKRNQSSLQESGQCDIPEAMNKSKCLNEKGVVK